MTHTHQRRYLHRHEAAFALFAVIAISSLPVDAATLKAVQSGTTAIPAAAASISVTLATAVDPTRSFLVFGVAEAENQPATGQVVGQLSSATTVDFLRNIAAGAAITINWYVAEFSSGVSVQRGTTVVPNDAPVNVTITSVNMSQAFPLVTMVSGGTTFDRNDFIRAKITGPTTLQLNHGDTGSTATAYWQVVEYQGAIVQTGDLTFNPTDLSLPATPGTPINPARSWLFFTDECHASPVQVSCGTTNISPRLFRGVITNGTTLTFDRSTAGTTGPPAEVYQLTWYLVEFIDGTTVQSGSEPFGAAETQRDVALPSGSAPTGRSFASASAFQRGGRSSYALDDVPGVGWFTLDLTSSSNLRLTRGSTNSPGPPPAAGADVGWFVITFNCDCQPLTTTEGAGTVTVTAPGSFEMTFDTATGGSISSFYDLYEDPTKTYDLAGGTGAGKALYGDGLGVGANTYNVNNNDAGVKLDVLEATAARVRVRQEAFYEQEPGAVLLSGIKAFGDYSIYPAGRLALRWNQRTTSAVTYVFNDLDFVVHLQSSGVLSNWTPYRQNGATFPGVGIDDFLLAQIELPGARTDFLDIMYKDWTTGNGNPGTADTTDWFPEAVPNERGNPFWGQELSGATIPAPTGPYSTQIWPGVWNFLTYFKPTNFANQADTAVTSRSADYRTPSSLSVLVGGPWQSASENTGGGDDYNESEGAYVATLDPTNGLTVRIDGSVATPRYHPFLKIRQWRSLAGPSSVTLQGTPLTRDADYRADVKPVSRAAMAIDLTWHSTLEDANALGVNLDVGTSGGQNGVTFVSGKYGNGALFDANTDTVTAGSTGSFDFNAGGGAVEFWYQPSYAHADGVRHVLWSNQAVGPDYFLLEKTAGPTNNLVFTISNSGASASVTVNSSNYSWRANDWVHIRTEWRSTAPAGLQLRMFIDGVEPTHTDAGTYNAIGMNHGPTIFGSCGLAGCPTPPNANANGNIDEPHIYFGGSPVPLAHGGLITNAEEWLANANAPKNFTLSFTGIDATSRRGRYLYLGADSQFRGLNVALATPGVGVAAGDLDWKYWNGTAWADLESVGGFTDETDSFTKTGSAYWGDPPGWSPYSENGGPDLYYVRVHLKTGSTYSTYPVESGIKTDILLFQYCGDITAPAQQFVFPVPPPTAVTLQSFSATGVDSAVELNWKTSSELNNLGFHLYRSISVDGPYQRITSSLIPGLGSSPSGAAYQYVDSGLSNGTTYYYQLEDIETTGKTKRHGPVSAIPEASVSPVISTTPPVEPTSTGLRVVEKNSHHLVLELKTGRFTAEPQPDGSVRLSIPGFSEDSEPGSPAIPVLRSWVEVDQGLGVRITSVRAEDVEVFTSLRPAATEAPELFATRQGTVVAGHRRRREGASFRGAGLYPEEAARLLEVGYQGETKKALIEFSPLRWNRTTGELLFARRLLVELSLAGPESARRKRTSGAGRVVALRFSTRERGLYGVSFEELSRRSGRRVRADSLRLSRLGEPVAFHVEPSTSMLYFLSEGAAVNPYGNEAVYELELQDGGTRMPLISAPASGNIVSFAWQHLGREENRYYQAGLVDAEDLWLWDLLFAPVSKSYSFEATALASTAEPSRVSVWLQGVSDLEASPDHHLRLSVNGTLLTEAMLEGKKPLKMTAEVPPGVLREGENALELENVGDTGAAYSMVMLNRFEVSYPRKLVTEGGVFEGSFPGSGVAQVEGLPGGSFVLDTSEPIPRWLEAGNRFPVEASRRYLVTSPQAVFEPELRTVSPSGLKTPRNQADYLVIAPQAFLDSVQPLLELRRSQGLRSRAVAIEDVYSAFGFGEGRPEALKEFLSFAYHSWQKPSPRYVLLLGDGTYDFKDYLKTGVKNQVPPWMVKTSYLWTASDSAYAAVNGEDLLPDLALGRLPAANAEEARAMVEKILSYESSGSFTQGPFVLVADNADVAGTFEAHADELASTVLAGREPRKIYLSRLGTEATRSHIVKAFDEGASLWSYLGHGGIQLWAQEDIFDTTQVSALRAQSRRPLVLTLNCLNGYFHFPYFDSLAEALVKAKGKGAVAAFSPSGLSLDEPAHLYHRLLLQELLSGKNRRVGDAVLAAQSDYADSGAFPELLSIYHLFGDPATSLR